MQGRKRKSNSPERWRLLVGLGLLVTLCGVAFVMLPTLNPIERHARALIEFCSATTHPEYCYEKEVPKLIDQGLTLEETFEVLARIQETTDEYFYCHTLGHGIAAKETAKDPASWTDVLTRCPTGICSNGCLHGVAQERFRGETLTDEQIDLALPELTTLCNDTLASSTIQERVECRHALGHLALYVTGADIPRAVSLCERITRGTTAQSARSCYEGVFMQLYQPIEPEDVALVKDVMPQTKEEGFRLCEGLTGAVRSACLTEAWVLEGWKERLPSPTEFEAFCARGPAEWESRCRKDMFGVFTALFRYDQEKVIPFCESFDGELKAECFAYSASNAIFTDQRLSADAAALCGIADEEGVGTACYEELLVYSAYAFTPDSVGFKRLCDVLPNAWKERCYAGDGATLLSGILSETP